MKISNLFISVLGAVSAFAATLVAAPTPGSPEGARSALASVVEPGRGSHPSKRRDPWNKWAKNPITVRLSLQANNVYAATNSTVEITLADSHLTVNGRSCTDLTNSAPSCANMNLRREYLLTVVATNLQSMEMDLQVQPNWQPISTSGKDEAPTDYSLWVDRSPGSTITGGQVYASTNCNYY